MARIKFNVSAAIAQAWKQIWEEKATSRANPSSYRGSEGFYITRMEIIRKVRAYAYADLKGLPREKADHDYGVRFPFLDGAVCNWLSSQERRGVIEGHAFGLTGRRYRPKGSELSEVEQRTLDKKANRTPYEDRPVHACAKSPGFSRPLCVPARKRGYRAPKPSNARMEREGVAVNCPRCLKLLATKEIA
jgi:hypothetical protein